jgi:hypothetical protein
MSNTPYFDAYMRGERSRDYKKKREWDDFVRRWIKLGSFQQVTTSTGLTFTIRPGTYTIDRIILPPNTSIRGEGFRPTYMRNS